MCSGLLHQAQTLSREDLDLLKIRTNVAEIFSVCSKHKLNYLDFFAARQAKCCDPLFYHSHAVMGSKEVTNVMYLQSKRCDKFVSPWVPGTKLCKRCGTEVLSLIKDIEVTDFQQLSGSSGSEPDYLPQMLHDAGGSILNVIMPIIPEVI